MKVLVLLFAAVACVLAVDLRHALRPAAVDASHERPPKWLTGELTQFALNDKTASSAGIPDPLIFVSPLTYNGPDPAVPRVVSHASETYTIRIKEPKCNDGPHPMEETAYYFVVPKGGFEFGGATVQTFTASMSVEADATVSFPTAYASGTPKCFAYIQTFANDDWLSVRLLSTTSSGLTARIETDEKSKLENSFSNNAETVAFMCFPPDTTQLAEDEHGLWLGTAATTNNHQIDKTSYSISLGKASKAFSMLTTRNGPNPTIVRHDALTDGSLSFKLQEDHCKDQENHHVGETVAAFGFFSCPENNALNEGMTACECAKGFTKSGEACNKCAAGTFKGAVGNGECTACPAHSSSPEGSTEAGACKCDKGYSGDPNSAEGCVRDIMWVVGELTNFAKTDKTASSTGIPDPLIFVSPLTYNGPNPAVPRVVSHASDTYTIRIKEPKCNDGIHYLDETAYYFIVRNGGFEYGGANVQTFTGSATVQADTTISFPTAYSSGTPKCFAYIQTFANDDWLSVRIKTTTATSVTVRIETDEKSKKQNSFSNNAETVGFMCFPPDTTTLTGEDGTVWLGSASTTNNKKISETSYSIALGSATKAFSMMTTLKGGNPTIVRHNSLTDGSLSFKLQEDQCQDQEDHHVAETVSAFGFN